MKSFWQRVVRVSIILFFVYLGDAILSDWVPAYIQSSVGSPLVMGMIISFSSLVGLGADLVFPQLLKEMRTKKLFAMAIGTSLVFCGVLFWTVSWPLTVLFLLGMAVWGIYYEFLGFGGQQFVYESVPAASRSGAWAIMGVFKSLAYFLGPVIGSYLAIKKGNSTTVMVAAGLVMTAYLLWLWGGKSNHKKVEDAPYEKVNILNEMRHWKTLFVHVWPVLSISLIMGIVDATFWTTGTVLSDRLANQNWWGGMFLPFYMLPMIFVGLIVARWGIYKGKKKTAEKFLLLSGILLSLLGVSDSVTWMLVLSLAVGITLSIAWPLTNAVYSDIVSRMGKEGKHMVGLSGSTLSVAYIIGPIMAGYVASLVGERWTFMIMGIFMAITALILLGVTPRKLKLPQLEISVWE